MSQGHVFHVVLIVSTQPKTAPTVPLSQGPGGSWMAFCSGTDWGATCPTCWGAFRESTRMIVQICTMYYMIIYISIILYYNIRIRIYVTNMSSYCMGDELYTFICGFYWIQVDVICAFWIAFWCCKSPWIPVVYPPQPQKIHVTITELLGSFPMAQAHVLKFSVAFPCS